ncbi:Selenocysteine insertion sequence-binding protein 2-like, partial [Trichinella pseudospiralis]
LKFEVLPNWNLSSMSSTWRESKLKPLPAWNASEIKVKDECKRECKLPKKTCCAKEKVKQGNFLDSTAPIKTETKSAKVNANKKPNRTVIKKAIIQQRQINANSEQDNNETLNNNNSTSTAVEKNAKILQLIDNAADEKLFCAIENLIIELKRLQDRVYQTNPTMALQKRRVVLGLREVEAHIRRDKIKMVIFAMDLEDYFTFPDGTYQYVSNVIAKCRQACIPYVFGLNRKHLAKICMKRATVAVVGILDHQGATQQFNELKEMIAELRKSQMNNAVIDSIALMSVADEHVKNRNN